VVVDAETCNSLKRRSGPKHNTDMKLSPFQQRLLDSMEPGNWCCIDYLPTWFYERASQPLQTIDAMVRKGVLGIRKRRHDGREIEEVCKKYGLEKPSRTRTPT